MLPKPNEANSTPETNPDTRLFSWHSVSSQNLSIPKSYRFWINLTGSITQALKERANDFNVEVLEQKRIYISLPIQGFDNHSGPSAYFSRKVLLKNASTPWVAAHTLIPESSLRNGLNALTKLDNKPIGEILFSSPHTRKDHEQVCKTQTGWGRRARYFLHNQPLLVTEYFLPSLINYENDRSFPVH